MLEYSKGIKVLIMEQSLIDTNNQQERYLELAWLAGIWEGEGNFSLTKGSKSRMFPRAVIINTDFKLIEEIATILKKNLIGFFIQTRVGGCNGDSRHKDAKVITVSGYKRVENFLKLLLPYLKGKKKEIASELLTYTTRRLELGPRSRYSHTDFETFEKIRSLNKKGTSISSETIRQPSLNSVSEDIVHVVSS